MDERWEDGKMYDVMHANDENGTRQEKITEKVGIKV